MFCRFCYILFEITMIGGFFINYYSYLPCAEEEATHFRPLSMGAYTCKELGFIPGKEYPVSFSLLPKTLHQDIIFNESNYPCIWSSIAVRGEWLKLSPNTNEEDEKNV